MFSAKSNSDLDRDLEVGVEGERLSNVAGVSCCQAAGRLSEGKKRTWGKSRSPKEVVVVGLTLSVLSRWYSELRRKMVAYSSL